MLLHRTRSAKPSRFWPTVQVKLPYAFIRQLFVAERDRAYALYALTDESEPKPWVRRIVDPTLARYFERQLETVLGLSDRPVQSELAKNAPAPRRAHRWRGRAFQAAFLLLFVAGPIGALRYCGAELSEGVVADEPREIPLEQLNAGAVYFTSEVDFQRAEFRYRDDIPRSAVVRIQLLQDGRPVGTISCDPMEVSPWYTSSSND